MIAANVMTTDTITLTEHNTVGDAINVLAENKIRQVPVVDRENRVLGVMTARSVIVALLPAYITKGYLKDVRFAPEPKDFVEKMEEMKTIPLGEFLRNRTDTMADEYVCVSPDTSTMELAAIFINRERRVERILVVDNNQRLLGIISPIDVFKKLWKQST